MSGHVDDHAHEMLRELLDICWEIRRAFAESGDIGAGQFLGREFEEKLDSATSAFGSLTKGSPKEALPPPHHWEMVEKDTKAVMAVAKEESVILTAVRNWMELHPRRAVFIRRCDS